MILSELTATFFAEEKIWGNKGLILVVNLEGLKIVIGTSDIGSR